MFAEVLNDIAVSSKPVRQARILPPPGNYTVQLVGVGPSINQFGNLNKEFGRPLFEVEELTIEGPFPHSGDFKLWQKLPMTDTKEFDRTVNYLRDLVRAYDESAEFNTATEAFELINQFVTDGQLINVRLTYYAEDFKGAKATKETEGLNVPFSSLTPEQVKRRNEIDRQSKIRGAKAFDNGDGTYNNTWTSPFGNEVPVRLAIQRFYNASYDPFTS
jgi:hypothetical protein